MQEIQTVGLGFTICGYGRGQGQIGERVPFEASSEWSAVCLKKKKEPKN